MGHLLERGGALATMLVLAACAGDPAGGIGGGSGGEPPAVEAWVDPAQSALVLTFEDDPGVGDVLTSLVNSGTASVSVRTVTSGDGAAVGRAGYPDGGAVRLPAYSASDPGYAIVSVTNRGDGDPFSPGPDSFSFGADFSLDAESSGTDADNGDNLLQRGLYDATGQYKIQLDGGRPSCRVMGSAGGVSVKASTRVVPGRWYRVWCTRRGDTVTLELGVVRTDGSVSFGSVSDDAEIGSVLLPRRTPLSVGGKLNADGTLTRSATDQFNGSVDRVFYRLLG